MTSRERPVLPVTGAGEFQDRCRIKLLEGNGSSGELPAATMLAAMDCFHLLGLVVILGLPLAFLIRHFEIGAAPSAGH